MEWKEFETTFSVKLNQQQKEAVQSTKGPVLLLAVPGSGKTTVLVTRLGYMIYCKNIPPESILTVTYTVAATKDMSERFAVRFGEDMAKRLEFRTINGICARIIQYYGRRIGKTPFELVKDEKATTGMLIRICQDHGMGYPTESDLKNVRTLITLGLTMDSYFIPLLFMLSIGMAIIYNLGSNYFLGEISYITKALAAVLQLGVTLDYSIFLMHSYEEQQARYNGDKERAMAHAISQTFSSVIGSSVTTVAGFIALCFMTFTLGMDIGVVMVKGVVLGVIACVTILPSMILCCDKWITKTMHKPFLPDIGRISDKVTKRYMIYVIIFLVLLFPAIYGNNHTSVYYNLDETLPKDLPSIIANEKLKEDYDMNTTHMILVDSSVESADVAKMINKMDDVDGVKWALGLDALIGPAIPQSMIPDSVTEMLKNDKYQLLLVNSEYKVASDELNVQIKELNKILHKYDKGGMLIGEGPLTADLIDITDTDFKTVSVVSIGIIFVIILILFKSISLPIILVGVIEFAIFVNMGIPYYTGTKLPFVASIVIGTIQLGSTVDYAILMTTRYKRERNHGAEKYDAITTAHRASAQSIMVSAMSFFAATIGVGLYSNIDMISSLCILMARGAIISMIVVIFVLPSMFMVFDKVIVKTSKGFLP